VKTAVRTADPASRLLIVQCAVPEIRATSAHTGAEPRSKVTVPDGVPAVLDTVLVNNTTDSATVGPVPDVKVVVVDAAPIPRDKGAEAELA